MLKYLVASPDVRQCPAIWVVDFRITPRACCFTVCSQTEHLLHGIGVQNPHARLVAVIHDQNQIGRLDHRGGQMPRLVIIERHAEFLRDDSGAFVRTSYDREAARHYTASAFWTLVAIALVIGVVFAGVFQMIPW